MATSPQPLPASVTNPPPDPAALGGVSGYGGVQGGTTTNPALAIGTGSDASSIQPGGVSVNGVPVDLGNIVFAPTAPSSPGSVDAEFPAIQTLLHALHNLDSGYRAGYGVTNTPVLDDVLQAAGASRSAYRFETVIRASNQLPPGTKDTSKIRNAIVKELRDRLQSVGIRVGDKVQTASQFNQLSLPSTLHDHLVGLGYNQAKIGSLGQAIQEQPQGVGGSPGSNGLDMYKTFQKNYGNGSTAYASKMYADLLSSGLIDSAIAAQDPTKAAALAYQELIGRAHQAGMTATQMIAKLQGETQQVQVPENVMAGYVDQIANDYGVTLDQPMSRYLADQITNAGATGSQAEMLVRQSLAKLYSYNPTAPQTGYPAIVEQSVRDMFGQYGQTPSSTQLTRITQSVLAQAPSSEYQAREQADALAEQTAKAGASALYPGLAAQVNQGMTIHDIIQPYAQRAEQVLGVDSASITASDPKWSKALNGNNGAPMTLSEWEQTMMQDPQYDYAHSQTARNRAASLGMSLRELFGLQGQGSSSEFGYSPSYGQ